MISPTLRTQPDKTQHSQQRDIHSLGGIRIHNPSKWAAADPRLKVDRGQLKRDGTRAETRFRLSAKRTSPFKSAGGGHQFSRLLAAEVYAISGSNAGYTMFRGSVKGTGYPLHSPVSPSLPLPRVTVCHHISTGVYTRVTLPRYLTPYRDSVDRVTHQKLVTLSRYGRVRFAVGIWP